MIFVGLLLFFLSAQQYTAALQCYTCDDIDDFNGCKTISDCKTGQSCFTRSYTNRKNLTFSWGCTDNEKCGNIPVYQSRSSSSREEKCYECCSSEKCNIKLCKHQQPPPCEDTDDKCAYYNKMFNICENIHQGAKLICRKFCKLCSLVDGNWADWSPWSSCDVTCGQGTHTRTRTCTNPAPAYQGLDCDGNNTETKPCVRPLCPVHGSWSDWSKWGSCSVTCGIGLQKRQRSCTNPYPLRCGNHCFGDAFDVQLCMQGPCEVTDGEWASWGKWSDCSATCDFGLRQRSRSCTNPHPGTYGKYCDGDTSQVQTCNSQACRNPSDTHIAFNANTASSSINSTVVFTNVMFDYDGNYNRSTGVFTAPRNGTYSFSAQLCVQSRFIDFDIMVDDVSIDYASNNGYLFGTCALGTTLTELKTNQKVFVRKGRSSLSSSNFFIGMSIH